MNNTTSLTKLHHEMVAVTEERDALAAELQKLREQKPVTYRVVGTCGMFSAGSMSKASCEEYIRQSKEDGSPWDMVIQPLYAAPVAAPAVPAPHT